MRLLGKRIHLIYESRNFGRTLLALLWTAGLISGTYIAVSCGDSLLSLMRRAPMCSVSVVGLLFVLLFPFLISAAAVYFNKTFFIFPFAFFKALNYSFCVTASVSAFGSAGWIIRLLLLFSSGCTVPVLYWFWMRQLSDSRKFIFRDLAISSAFVLFFSGIDYGIISPFLASIIQI